MTITILTGDCRAMLKTLPDQSFHCCVTSPPYFGLRDYGVGGQIGLEPTPDEYVSEMVGVFREVRRVLRDDGVFWLNVGDSYCVQRPIWGIKHKDLIGIPWMLAFALRADGWYLRSDVIWAKPNGMPGSQDDRCTSSHEHVFQFSKRDRYFSDFDAIKTPPRESTRVRLAQDIQAQAGSHLANGGGKTNGTMKAVAKADKPRGHSRRHAGFNDRWDAMKKCAQQASPAMMRDVWFVSPGGCSDAHFAVMPDEIARRCILAGTPDGGSVLDPFGGAGTTALVADRLGRHATMIELNPDYVAIARERIARDAGMFAELVA